MSDVLMARNVDRQIGAFLVAGVIGLGAVLYIAFGSSSESSDLISIAQGYWGAYQVKAYVYPVGTMDPTILINSKKIDTQIISGTNVMTRWNTVMTFAGLASGNYTATLPATPSDTCVDLMTDAGLSAYIVSIGVTSGTQRTPPADPSVAAADCGAGTTNSMTVTFKPRPAS